MNTPPSHDPAPDRRAFASLKEIADTARREKWQTGKALVTARLFLLNKRDDNRS